MKKPSLTLAALALVLAQTAAAEDPAATADRMLDPTRNTAAFKDPKAFAEWSQQMMNPATSMALAQKGIDPNTYLRMTAGMMNPATLQNYMQLTDPAVAMKWMAAGLNPNFYTALLGQGLNPANLSALADRAAEPAGDEHGHADAQPGDVRQLVDRTGQPAGGQHHDGADEPQPVHELAGRRHESADLWFLGRAGDAAGSTGPDAVSGEQSIRPKYADEDAAHSCCPACRQITHPERSPS
jgi:hypothetical protein